MKPAFPQVTVLTTPPPLGPGTLAGCGGAQTFRAYLPLDQTLLAAFPNTGQAKPTPSLPAPGVGGALAMNTAKRSRLAASQQWGLVLGCELHASLHLHRSLSLGPTAWLLPPALHHGLESSEFCWPLGCGFCAGKAAMTPLILPLERPIHPGPTGAAGVGISLAAPSPQQGIGRAPPQGTEAEPCCPAMGGFHQQRAPTDSFLTGRQCVSRSVLSNCLQHRGL